MQDETMQAITEGEQIAATTEGQQPTEDYLHTMQGILTKVSYIEERSNRVVQGYAKLKRDIHNEVARMEQNAYRCQGNEKEETSWVLASWGWWGWGAKGPPPPSHRHPRDARIHKVF